MSSVFLSLLSLHLRTCYQTLSFLPNKILLTAQNEHSPTDFCATFDINELKLSDQMECSLYSNEILTFSLYSNEILTPSTCINSFASDTHSFIIYWDEIKDTETYALNSKISNQDTTFIRLLVNDIYVINIKKNDQFCQRQISINAIYINEYDNENNSDYQNNAIQSYIFQCYIEKAYLLYATIFSCVFKRHHMINELNSIFSCVSSHTIWLMKRVVTLFTVYLLLSALKYDATTVIFIISKKQYRELVKTVNKKLVISIYSVCFVLCFIFILSSHNIYNTINGNNVSVHQSIDSANTNITSSNETQKHMAKQFKCIGCVTEKGSGFFFIICWFFY